MKIKTQDLFGTALDWAVAKCEFDAPYVSGGIVYAARPEYMPWAPSADWSQGGPIIDAMFKEGLALYQGGAGAGNQRCWAERNARLWHGPTPLVAAMRCYVASKLGNEVDVPEELL